MSPTRGLIAPLLHLDVLSSTDRELCATRPQFQEPIPLNEGIFLKL